LQKELVKVAALKKRATHDILRPYWLLASIDIGFPLPIEPKFALFLRPESEKSAHASVDRFGDSYTTPLGNEELRDTMSKMAISGRDIENAPELIESFLDEFDEKDSVARLFAGCVVYLDEPRSERLPPYDSDFHLAEKYLKFGKATIEDVLEDSGLTHVVVEGSDPSRIREIRSRLSGHTKALPRMVTVQWVLDSVKEKTRIDESRYAP